MSRYLDWRLDELYPEERGVTTKKTGRRGPRGEGNFVWELPGAAFKSIMEGQQLQHETEQKIIEGIKSEAGTLAQKTWKGLKGSGPIQSRQRREPFKPIPWIKHPANPYTQLSENQKHEINSKPINDFTNRNVDPGAWNVPKGLVERTMDWNLNPKWFSQEKGVVPSVLGGEEWTTPSPLNEILSTQGSKKGGDKSDSDETAEKWKGASEILKNVAKISSLWDEDESTWMGTGFSFMG